MIIFPSHFTPYTLHCTLYTVHLTPYTLFFHFNPEEALYFYTSVCQKLFAVQPL
jgi:hypothetical protein